MDSPPKMIQSYSGPKIEEVKKTQSSDDYFSTGGATELSLSVSSLSWNSKGSILAVGYSFTGHLGWCGHRSFLRTWATSTSKQDEYEVEGCISSLEFSNSSPSILAIGTFNGVLITLDLDKGEILSRSSIDEYQHRESISGLLWVPQSQYSLYSISTDGKVLNWNQENLEFPIRGVLIKGKHELEGGTCFAVTEDCSSLIIGAESGRVMKYSIPSLITQSLPNEGLKIRPDAEVVLNNMHPTYRQQLLKGASKFCIDLGLKEVDIRALFINKPDITKVYPSAMNLHYERHDGPVTAVACNPFHRNLFATSSTDSYVKVYNGLNSRANLVLEPVVAGKIIKISWSEVRPLVLAVGCDNGSVYIYDFLQSKTHYVLEISYQRNFVSDVRFNKRIKDYLAIGYRSGEVRVYQLPDIFNVAHPDEGRRLALLLEDVLHE